MSIKVPFRVVYIVSKVANMAFTGSGDPTTSPTWYDILIDNLGSSQAILNTSGGSTGWSIIDDGSAIQGFSQSSGFNDSFFPVDTIANFWYLGSTFVLTVSGLNNAKTYDFRVAGAFGGGNRSSYTIGSTTQTMASDFDDLLFSAVSPSSGAITITCIPSTGGLAFINAVIIKEN